MDSSALLNLFAREFGPTLPTAWESLNEDARVRLGRLALSSPLYSALLRQFPAWALWLEEERNLRQDYRYQALLQEWRAFAHAGGESLHDPELYLERLRLWRRLMSLRIAYRSVNGFASERTTVEELSRLAEYCLRECYFLATKRWCERVGEPWDEEQQRPARFCVLALGKLGGQELNFSSDVDVIFLYEGDGYCRKNGQSGAYSNVEYFTKVAETLIAWLGAKTAAGFLFRVDARLRPEGAYGPLVRSTLSLENYYAVAGQTWERLALLKARPVVGDLALGGELLENLHSFRYPAHPPLSLLTEVAAMKSRTEREIVGAESLERNVKSGAGGIREIEFIAQAHQLLHAGHYPFLQTYSTQAALEQLTRYGLIESEQAHALIEAYWFLRQVEHRIQMRDEQQSHTLPEGEALLAIAESLDFPSVSEFEARLAATRQIVRRAYAELFSDRTGTDRDFERWWAFFTGSQVPDVVEKKLQHWLRGAPDAADELRRFALGDANHLVTREHVTRFQSLASSFDELMPKLARPIVTLKRVARFAERYASRSHFFASCASNPRFFQVLALLFDRSGFLCDLLCAHPEIFEEVLRPEILQRRKTDAALASELAEGPTAPEEFARWLPLYIRAEQVRYSIAELLDFIDTPELEASLSRLADAVLAETCSREPELKDLLVVALGKYGGAELTFGSDLDVLFVAETENVASLEAALRRSLRLIQATDGLGPALVVDTRLRPHGEAGPLVCTLDAFESYHRSGAQLWERQLLTRARVVRGPRETAEKWTSAVDGMIFREPLEASQMDEIWRMRLRIQNERDVTQPPQRAFKTAAGGLVDHEFFVQIQQLRHGWKHPSLRTPGTRSGLAELAHLKLIPEAAAIRLSENYEFLKCLEIMTRRDENRAVSVLPADLNALAQWLNFPSVDAFWNSHQNRMTETRETVLNLLFRPV